MRLNCCKKSKKFGTKLQQNGRSKFELQRGLDSRKNHERYAVFTQHLRKKSALKRKRLARQRAKDEWLRNQLAREIILSEPQLEFREKWQENRLWFFEKCQHFRMGKHMTKEDYQLCPVCLDENELSKDFTRLPCKHCFHTTCIEKWLLEKDTCPMCKRDFRDHDYFKKHDPNYKDKIHSQSESYSSLMEFYDSLILRRLEFQNDLMRRRQRRQRMRTRRTSQRLRQILEIMERLPFPFTD